MQMLEFLQLVASGKRTFSANNDSDLPSFQSTVLVAQDAYKAGYIGTFKPHRESTTGTRSVDRFTVDELTDDGLRFINSL